MPEKVRISTAANDDQPFFEESCAEAGFDRRCRDDRGRICPFHARFCHGPDYPCVDRLRHFVALSFLEELARAHSASRRTSSSKSGATPPPPTMLTTLPGAARQTLPPSRTPGTSEA